MQVVSKPLFNFISRVVPDGQRETDLDFGLMMGELVGAVCVGSSGGLNEF